MTRFYVQDEGVYVPTDDLAQAFAALNFIQENSLGIGTDTLIPVANPDNPGWIADIKTQDLWGYVGDGNSDIYRMTQVGIMNGSPGYTLDITGTLHATESVEFDDTLDVDGDVTFNSNTSSTDKDTGALVVTNGGVGIEENLNVGNNVVVSGTTPSTDKDTGSLVVEGGVGIEENLNVGQNAKIIGTLELDDELIDVDGSPGIPGRDFRLSAIDNGVRWRPPGVETQNAIWVTKDGDDANTGLLEGDAKATIGAAAAIAQPGDTIFIRSGTYVENNPIGLRRDVSISGQDLRLVTVIPQNAGKDIFHVRRGCLVENLSFAKNSVSISQEGGAAVAFPPTEVSQQANTGFIELGPTDEGPSGRWKSPYIRNCTNFMTESIGMKIDGNHAVSSTIGADLKSMVCDSFTQYNENGIGVSITNNGYAQLVSIFTINCDIAIYADTGGSCDLTNSNSSFGNYGLVAVGLGSTEFTGIVSTYPPTRPQPGVDAGSDVVALKDVFDDGGNPRRPYDGQALFFQIKNPGRSRYPDAEAFDELTKPMVQVQEIIVENGGSGFSALNPPTVIVIDNNDFSQQPKGPQGIIAELSPTIDELTGSIVAIDVVNSGRNYLPTQDLRVFIDGGDVVGASATVITRPIYYTVDVATEQILTGVTTVTFNEFIPYELFGDENVSLKRISRILTSSHSFEYVGTGIDINISTPFKGSIPIKENEIVALDGAQVPFTSTDQKGNFDIGEGFQINQPTATIRGRDFSKSIQAEVTPLILALR